MRFVPRTAREQPLAPSPSLASSKVDRLLGAAACASLIGVSPSSTQSLWLRHVRSSRARAARRRPEPRRVPVAVRALVTTKAERHESAYLINERKTMVNRQCPRGTLV